MVVSCRQIPCYVRNDYKKREYYGKAGIHVSLVFAKYLRLLKNCENQREYKEEREQYVSKAPLLKYLDKPVQFECFACHFNTLLLVIAYLNFMINGCQSLRCCCGCRLRTCPGF